MVGMPGRSGTNKGKDKPFRDALRLAIADADDNPRKLRHIAEALFDKACDGDVAAIKEIADRLDGKVAQGIDMEANVGLTDPLIELFERIASNGRSLHSQD